MRKGGGGAKLLQFTIARCRFVSFDRRFVHMRRKSRSGRQRTIKGSKKQIETGSLLVQMITS